MTDVDGNHYDAVKIGNQVWMQSNLRTTRFRDGSAIPRGSSSSDYSNSEPYYYKPTTRDSIWIIQEGLPPYNEKTYGLYYNWPTVDDVRGLCPKGWHVPSKAEWIELKEYVSSKSEYVSDGDPELIGKALASTVGWRDFGEGSPGFEPEKNNATGFSAFPTGYGYHQELIDMGISATFWSSENCGNDGDQPFNAWFFILHTYLSMYADHTEQGRSVRCLRDK